MPAAITNIAIPALTSKYFSSNMVVLPSIFPRLLRNFRAARERRADDLSENKFLDQQRRGQRECQPADDYQTLQHRFHDCLRALAERKCMRRARVRRLKAMGLMAH